MASGSSASATATKKSATTTDAPIWKNYLAVRSEIGATGSSGVTSGHARSRKRAKPSSSLLGNRSGAGSISTSQPPLQSDVALRVRAYWEQLSASERQQVLFIDEPDLVKQLYKLNLSLLCVGLMQRHLKTPLQKAAAATAAATTTTTTKPVADTLGEKTYELLEAMEFMDIGTGILTVKSELVEVPARLFALVGDVLMGFASSLHVLSDAQFLALFVTESEVVTSWEDYERLIAMLVEQLMLKSYVRHLEREAARQMEQLLLEVSLEDSAREWNGGGGGAGVGATASVGKRTTKKKKQKAKAKAKATANATAKSKTLDAPAAAEASTVTGTDTAGGDRGRDQPEPEDFDNCERGSSSREQQQQQQSDTTDSEGSRSARDSVEPESVDDFVEDQEMALAGTTNDNGDERVDASMTTVAAEVSHRERLKSAPVSPEQARSDRTARPQAPTSSLNPNASVFQPQQDALTRGTVVGKRKLDKFIVSIDALDAAVDCDNFAYFCDDDDDLSGVSDDDDTISGEDRDDGDRFRDVRHRKVARWRRDSDDDLALEWQLQQIYASTSTMLGWDFARQCDIEVAPPRDAPMLWDAADALWRTAPRDVVRYFTPGREPHAFGAFFSPSPPPPPPPSSSHVHAYPFAAAASGFDSATARYYYAPPPTASSSSSAAATFLPPPPPPGASNSSNTSAKPKASQLVIKSYYHSH